MKKPNLLTYEINNEFLTKEDFLNYLSSLDIPFIRTNKKIEYANISSVIDIETSSFKDNDTKVAVMYCFTFGINGTSYLGRTYEDLIFILDKVKDIFQLSLERRLIIYIHNLGYEFQFFYKRFSWNKIFATNDRTPLTALTNDGIEFRCSYLLSGYSLSSVGEHLQKYPCKKLIGDLDYSLIRSPETPLTDKEKGYVLNDGIIVMNYIQEQIENHKNNITKLSLTKTGEVRKYCRNECLYGGGGSHKKTANRFNSYRRIMLATRIQSVNEYKQLKNAFMGGFTHANPICVDKEVNNVTSYDFTSSYPYVMISEKFPMLKGELINIKDKKDFERNLDLYCCLFDVTFFNIESKIYFEHYLSFSHCRELVNYKLDNGRIVRADKLTTTLTEQDFFIIKECYKWDKMRIVNFRRYKRDYLPTPFINAILQLYKKKTELKGVEGKENDYLYSKELLNSCYGMCVTDICRLEREFDTELNEWKKTNPIIDYEKNITQYNESKRRFLSYAWGIWVTAYARRNVWKGILAFNKDYLYSDTDSIKVINIEDHQEFINNYNKEVEEKLMKAINHHKLDFDLVNPKSVDGTSHMLGLWDNETPIPYVRFKTLGAKRYMVEYSKEKLINKEKDIYSKYSLTISGLNKKIAIPYLETISSDIFKLFKEDMFIPKGYTGKNIHTYIDEEREGDMVDYLGNKYHYHELTCVYMEESEYSLSLSREFVDYLLSIKLMEFN